MLTINAFDLIDLNCSAPPINNRIPFNYHRRIMVETVQVKIEGDNPNLDSPTQNQTSPHDTPTSNNNSGSAVTPETVELNNRLSGKHQFLDKLCLATVQGKHAGRNERTFYWPALRFSNQKEFLEDVKKTVGQRSYFKLAMYLHTASAELNNGCAIAFLLGRPAIKDSIIVLGEGMGEDFGKCYELLKDDDYKDNEMFKKAVEIVDMRIAERFDPSNEYEDDEDDEGTVAFDSGGTPPSPSYSNQARASTSPENQTGTSTVSTDQESEVITIEDTPAKSGGKDNKRKGKSKDGTASKKKKTSKQTPKSKTRGIQHPMVTPLPTNISDKDVSERLRDEIYTPHQIIEDDAAWNILAKFGIFCEDGKFYLPPTSASEDAKPAATFTSLMGLRKDLCAKGLPESIQPLSTKEKVDIARWVRYTHVKGLENGQELNPDDLGEHIPSKFMDKGAWPTLCNFGCSWNGGIYKVPLTPNGEETKTFETTSGVDGHFARFGIQCIPNDPGDNILSQKARLSIELFFATPSFEVLNTFERIDENAKRKRKRNSVSYGE